MNWYKCSQNKKWDIRSWFEMLTKAFDLMLHKKYGKFEPVANPQLGAAAFLNTDKDTRIDIRANIYSPYNADFNVSISDKTQSLGNFTFEFKGDDFNSAPYEIIKKIYDILNHPNIPEYASKSESEPGYDPLS